MRGYKSYGNYNSGLTMQDKIISGLSYLTTGLVGFIWIIVSHIRGQSLSNFTRFHIFQSIFIFILLYLLGMVFNILLAFVQLIPLIGPVVVNIVYYLKVYPMILGFSLINFSIIGVTIYLAVYSFLGKYGEIPWVSDTIRKMV